WDGLEPEAFDRSEPRVWSVASLAIPAGSFRRAGLALSGINSAVGNDLQEAQLTAEDVAGLALTGADLITLSGCDTSSGLLLEGEGALGLQRAFQLAGAKTVVGS